MAWAVHIQFQDVATGQIVVLLNPKSQMLVQVFAVVGAKPTHVGSTCPPATKRHSLRMSSIPPNIYVTIVWIHYIPVVVLCGCATHSKFYAQVHSNSHPLVTQPCAVAFSGGVHPILRSSPTYIFRWPAAKHTTEVTMASKNFNRRAIDTFLSHRIHLFAWNARGAFCKR